MDQMFAPWKKHEVRYYAVQFDDAWFLYNSKEERDALITRDAWPRQNGAQVLLIVTRYVRD